MLNRRTFAEKSADKIENLLKQNTSSEVLTNAIDSIGSQSTHI